MKSLKLLTFPHPTTLVVSHSSRFSPKSLLVCRLAHDVVVLEGGEDDENFIDFDCSRNSLRSQCEEVIKSLSHSSNIVWRNRNLPSFPFSALTFILLFHSRVSLNLSTQEQPQHPLDSYSCRPPPVMQSCCLWSSLPLQQTKLIWKTFIIFSFSLHSCPHHSCALTLTRFFIFTSLWREPPQTRKKRGFSHALDLMMLTFLLLTVF